MEEKRPGKPVIIKPADRQLPEGPETPGMDRRVALTTDGVWVGTVQTEPGVMTGWHHHGDYDTYVYTLAGDARLDYLDGEQVVMANTTPGDVLYIPKGVVHREGSASEEGIEAVLVRVGHGQLVFPLEDEDLPPAARKS